jgi:hypothetical protein
VFADSTSPPARPHGLSGADGVMIECFAFSSADSPYEPADWALQMDRVLRLVRMNRIVIGQSHVSPSDLRARGCARRAICW